MSAPSPEALALLSQPGRPDVAQYIQNFLDQNFPKSNIIVVSSGDNIEEKIRKGLSTAVEHNDAAQAVSSNPGIQEGIDDYAKRVTRATAQAHAEHFNENSKTHGVHVHNSDLSSFGSEGELKKLGLEVKVVNINRSLINELIPSDHKSSLACDAAIAPQDEPRAYSISLMQKGNQTQALTVALDHINTAFHETGHALNHTERGSYSTLLREFFSPTKVGNVEETIADTFASLMMIKEFGDLGLAYVKVHTAERLSPGVADTKHQTAFGMNAALKWAEQNGSQLQSMKPEDIFKLAKELGTKSALTPEEIKQMDAANNGHAMGAELKQKMDDTRDSLGPERRVASGIGISLGRLQAAQQLMCTMDAKHPAAPAPLLAPAEPGQGQTAPATASPNRPRPSAGVSM